MVMEIEGANWTRTRPWGRAPSALGEVIKPPVKEVGGYKTSLRIESNRPITAGEINLVLFPVLESLGLELVGDPSFVDENMPIWTWQVIRDENGKATGYEAIIAAGPLRGHTSNVLAPSDCTEVYDPKTGESLDWKCKLGTPSAKDTATLPRYIVDWSVLTRQVNLESPQSNLNNIIQAVREKSEPLRKIAISIRTSTKAVDVPAPNAKGAGKAASAAIIGIALALLTWRL